MDVVTVLTANTQNSKWFSTWAGCGRSPPWASVLARSTVLKMAWELSQQMCTPLICKNPISTNCIKVVGHFQKSIFFIQIFLFLYFEHPRTLYKNHVPIMIIYGVTASFLALTLVFRNRNYILLVLEIKNLSFIRYYIEYFWLSFVCIVINRSILVYSCQRNPYSYKIKIGY